MKRILEVVGRMDRAGQETFLMNLLRSYDPSQYEITFAVNSFHKGDYEDEIIELGGRVWHNKYTPSIRNLKAYLSELKNFLIAEGPFDVIHCHVFLFGGFILKVANEVGIPIRIMHSHNTSDGFKTNVYRYLYRKYALHLIKKHATTLVACGKDAYHGLFKTKCPSEKHILNNAIVPNNFKFLPNERETKLKELGISTNKKVIISIARFSPVKNHKRIIEIFDDLHKYEPDTILLLVGDGDLQSNIENQVKEKGIEDCVIFLGMREDIPSLLNASDVLLMPSLFEGLPVSLVEAQAAGTFCVVSSAITQEVDMNLNLISFQHLNDKNTKWIEAIIIGFSQPKINFSERMKQIEKKGYSINSTWTKLKTFYE